MLKFLKVSFDSPKLHVLFFFKNLLNAIDDPQIKKEPLIWVFSGVSMPDQQAIRGKELPKIMKNIDGIRVTYISIKSINENLKNYSRGWSIMKIGITEYLYFFRGMLNINISVLGSFWKFKNPVLYTDLRS